MAKYKKPGGKKKEVPAPTRGLIPCAFLILLILGLISVLFYYALQVPVTK